MLTFCSWLTGSRCGAFFIDIANLGMANIALPTIQKALGFDDGTLQWVLTAYALTVRPPWSPRHALVIPSLP